jgi:sec-independent protein translocase protein TatA
MGFGELLVILFMVLLFFGARRLPAIGAGLGKAIRGFKDSMRPQRRVSRAARALTRVAGRTARW